MCADLVELMDEFHQQGGLTEECAEEGIRVLQKFTFNFTRCDKFPYYQSGEDGDWKITCARFNRHGLCSASMAARLRELRALRANSSPMKLFSHCSPAAGICVYTGEIEP